MADTDRELLEMAAKAARIVVTRSRLDDPLSRDMLIENSVRNPHQKAGPWNPLTDDGDALRLAVKLRMRVEPWGSGASAVVSVDNRALAAEPHYGDDPERATRRAIVRAAAAIGGGK
mgnify:CR=1 FL=1